MDIQPKNFIANLFIGLSSFHPLFAAEPFGIPSILYKDNTTVLYINGYDDISNSRATKFIPNSSRIIFSNMAHDIATSKLVNLSVTAGHAAFRITQGQYFYHDNWGALRCLDTTTGVTSECDIQSLAKKLYDLKSIEIFLGSAEESIIYQLGDTIEIRNTVTMETQRIKIPGFVRNLEGASFATESKVLVFGSGKNPKLFRGHPGWFGYFTIDKKSSKIIKIQ
jgi:hypothetical protein